MEELQKEKLKLKEILKTIEEILVSEKKDLDSLYKDFVGDREELWEIAARRNIHITNLETSLDKPYFARIDFTSDDDNKVSTIYIGKNGVMKDNDIVVTDWRAPISSLYYDSELGSCSYEAPEGTINGVMNLKRQYEIEEGTLKQYFDVDLVSNDSLLQKYLNSNNDARLKSIVSTIQKEQNEVIRKKLNNNLIVQGVAGSGKTTVALHRIAYLVYNYINTIKQNQYLVIGPNPVFIKYIKSVLPELDVSGVEQCTFEQFAQDYLGEKIAINSSEKKVNASIAGKINTDIDKFKCSKKYKDMIDKFLELYLYSITSNDLTIGEFTIFTKDDINKFFALTNSNYSFSNRVDQTIELLCRDVEENNNVLLEAFASYAYSKFKSVSNDKEREELKKTFAKQREEIKKNCRNIIRKYFSKAKLDATKLYKLFINSLNDFDIYNYKHLNVLKKDTLSNIKNNMYDFEDLAALIYIKQSTNPEFEYQRIKHVVIDEAQDLGEFNFYVLKKILRNATFSIFGDLAQSIYDYRGISNWDQVNRVVFDNKGEIINFNKSYRTTSEIMSVADDVASSIGLNRSDLVVRHGNAVDFTQIDEPDQIPDYIVKKIEEYIKKGYKTIAIISKTNLMSCYINDDLAERGLILPNISINDDLLDDKFKICTISNQLAKGLEFDAVIINNANEQIYSSASSLDMKLLYVAITRALHELDIVYSGELTKPLQESLIKNKENVIKK